MAIALLTGSAVAVAAEDALRPWTIANSIAVRYFVTDQAVPGEWLPIAGEPITRSPSGKYFFFVMHHGDLACDCNVYELQVFAAGDVERALKSSSAEVPAPLRRVTMQSAWTYASFAGISRARWESERTIVFLGIEGHGPRNLFRLDVESGELKRLTDVPDRSTRENANPTGIFAFDLRGESVVYAMLTTRRQRTSLDAYPSVTITDGELYEMFDAADATHGVFSRYRGGQIHAVGSYDVTSSGLKGPWISPDGRWAIAAFAPADMPPPAAWSAYEQRTDALGGVFRFMLIDVRNGSSKPIFDAPEGPWSLGARDALWSADSRHVVIVNTALPLTKEQEDRQRMGYIVDFQPQTGRWEIIEPMIDAPGYRRSHDPKTHHFVLLPREGPGGANPTATRSDVRQVSRVLWLSEGRELLIQHQDAEGHPAPASSYVLKADRWVATRRRDTGTARSTPNPPLRYGLSVSVRQSANDPPAVVATDGVHERVITLPDPVLEGVWRARVERIQWTEGDGRTSTGGLMLPRSFSVGHPVPLVIQAYRYLPDLFRPDGQDSTANAAQSLVSEGMAVLFVNLPDIDRPEVTNTPAEAQLFVKRIDAAVAFLASRKIVDPARVGLIGFSRGGFMTYYAITHPGEITLAAAVDADGATVSYSEYVIQKALFENSPSVDELERQYGGGTFWQNKSAWLEQAPGFNVDKVRTPTLFACNSKISNLYMLETLGAFRLNRRPFEYINFPDGAHQLQRPRQRQASLEASVDWMNFWLQGKENPRSDRAARNERWRQLRVRQRAIPPQ